MLRPKYPIQTARLTLRPFAAGDLDDLYSFHSRPDVARYLYWEARTRDAVRGVLDRKIDERAILDEGGRISLAVGLRDSGTVIGEVMLRWLSREHRQGELGYVFHPDYGGRGFATEAARVALALGFDGLGLHRMIGRCDARNVASVRVLERLGMRREAHLVQNEWFKGEWSDELVYAMLAAEWRAARASRAGVQNPSR